MPTKYLELVIEGPRGWTLGFLEGFLRARKVKERLLDAEREGFDCEPLRERIREALRRSLETLHLLMPESIAPTVHEAIAAAGGEEVEVRHERKVKGMRFSMSVNVYSREHAKKIQAMLENRPAAAKLSPGAPFEEIHHPDDAGVEAYAPVHEYEWRGKGTVEGPVDAVLPLYRSCRDEQLIEQTAAILIAAGDS